MVDFAKQLIEGEDKKDKPSRFNFADELIGAADVPDAAENPERPAVSLSQLGQAIKFLDDTARSIAQGATFGFADEISAGLNTIFGAGSFEANVASERARDLEIPAGIAIPGQIAGGIGGSLIAAGSAPARIAGALSSRVPTGLGRAVTRGTAAGTAGGAAAGAGFAEGDLEERAAGATQGAAIGAVTGGVVAPVVRGAGTISESVRRVINPKTRALQATAKAFFDDEITPQAAAIRLKRLGNQAFVADVGDENVRALARAAGDQPGAAKKMVENALRRRARGQQNRILQLVQSVTSRRNFGETLDEVQATRKLLSDRLYAEAFDETPLISPPAGQQADNLAKLLKNPLIKKSITATKKIVRRNADGALTEFKDLPPNSLRILDQVYKDLGDKASAARRQGKGNLGFNLDELRSELKDILSAVSPKYREALDTFSSQTRLEEALEFGRKALDPKSGITPEMIAKMPELEREMFAIGFGQSVADIVENVPDRTLIRDATNKIFGTEALRRRIRAALPDDASFRQFVRGVLGEERFVETRRAAAPSIGSQTAPRLQAAESASGIPVEATAAAKGLAFAGPKGAGISGFAAFLSRLRALPERQRRQIAQIMMAQGPEAAQNALNQIFSAGEAAGRSAARQAAVPAASIQPAIQGP